MRTTKTGRDVKLRRPPACFKRRGDSFPRLPMPRASVPGVKQIGEAVIDEAREWARDRKSTRLNSSHLGISYAVFCLKKKKKKNEEHHKMNNYITRNRNE